MGRAEAGRGLEAGVEDQLGDSPGKTRSPDRCSTPWAPSSLPLRVGDIPLTLLGYPERPRNIRRPLSLLAPWREGDWGGEAFLKVWARGNIRE